MTVLNESIGVTNVLGEMNGFALGEVIPIFELPGALFDLLPTVVYVCDQDGLVLRYTDCKVAGAVNCFQDISERRPARQSPRTARLWHTRFRRAQNCQ
jgi:hypothetical protein